MPAPPPAAPKTSNERPPTPPAAGDGGGIVSLVRAAVEDNRFDLYLQPIVSLPQRKVRYYEAFSRLRDDSGNVLTPDRFLGAARDTGLITTIDNMLLFRCVQLIRKLKRRNKQVGFFCNLSMRTLQDEEFFAQFADFLSSQNDLPDSVIFEIAATELARAIPAVKKRLALLAGMGFSLSLDHVPSLGVNVVDLAKQGFRFVKIDAAKFVSASHQSHAAIAVADLKEAFRRHGVDLIAEKVETEATVVNLLDHNVDFGQGYLFGEPRQSREAA